MDSQLSPPTTPQKPEIWENHFIDYESDNEESGSGSDSDSDSESESESESSSYASQSFPSKPDAGSSGWPRKAGAVMLEGYVDGSDSLDGRSDGSVARTKSLTDDDLEELKGCLDLGFGFSYEEIPELCNTLPALELCYSMSQRLLDEKRFDGESDVGGSVASVCSSPSRSAIANWKISEPGDDPEEVKARLKYWAQAVACTVRLCNN